ncbi:PAS domain-containing protein [Actinoplanes awajinensis]|uniref:histidine kinase n=1 Tax=Actinoplanes awajinensis subsp. mycoplanecinus TaxID=135947 RepID=A0A124G910_9ACTN|nr:GAF domain-containing protein [Actinoplanes awajinensis]KUL27702.1 histidine kinase [Actinoplanes awajinensis subsp. mycoplanecinus]
MEQERLAALHEYQLRDTPPEAELRAVLRIAATVAGVASASLNLLDATRQYQLVRLGGAPIDCAREDSMCAVQFDARVFAHVPDAPQDPRYAANPWVNGALGRVRFYASAPLITPEGHALGTLCVFDEAPHELTGEQIAHLTDLAGIVIAFFERRRQARTMGALAIAARAKQQWTDALLETVDAAVIACDVNFRVTLWNRSAREWHGRSGEGDPLPVDIAARFGLFEPDGRTPVPDDELPLQVALRDGVVLTGREMVIRRPIGDPVRVRVNASPLRGPENEIVGAVLAQVDVTAEHTRRSLIEEAREHLAAANTELERSNADLTNFAAAVSHDLIAPLAAVGGFLELLAFEGYEQAAGGSAEVVRMRDVIDGLLADALTARSSGSASGRR